MTMLSRQDWHPADIIAAVKKRKTSLAALSRANGLCSSTLANALNRPWPKGEQIIAQAIGVSAAQIWPSRYFDEQGQYQDRSQLIRVRRRGPTKRRTTQGT